MTARAGLLALLAAASFAAAAQQPPSFKGKIKSGLYETKSEADMGNMPGVPADQKKTVSTKQRCLTDAEVDKLAEESNPACKTSGFKSAADGATFRITCAGNPEMTADVRIAYVTGGYTTESKVTLKPAGGAAPVNMSQRVTSKYLGPCPATTTKK